MANKRMFSLKIVDTDAFLDMPQTSQLLYFHLSMRADDDGFVSNPKKIMKIIGTSDDDIKVLIMKKFVIPFESGICVIRHWKIHNYIQKDRYYETQYLEEKSTLNQEKNGAYLLGNKEKKTKCIQNVSKLDTQVRLDKVRLELDKNKRETASLSYLSNIPLKDIEEFQSKTSATKEEIISKGEDLKNYCEYKGKTYKNYKAFLLIALKKDYKKSASKYEGL